jgi:hypothetical protein
MGCDLERKSMKIELKKHLKWLCICTMMLAVFGCKSKEEEQAELQDIAERTLSTTTYNYTKYELYHTNFMSADKKFEIESASPGGSVFFRNAGYEDLEDGTKVSFASGSCCFFWENRSNAPLKLRVVWSVIYSLSQFEGIESKSYDDRANKRPQPGSVWCEATVEISQPYPSKPGELFLHFFPDGTLAAHLGESGSLQFDHPLPLAEIKKHSTPLPQGQYCIKEIENPLYGIPRRPHME